MFYIYFKKIPRTDVEFFVIKDSLLVNSPQTPLKIEIMQNGLLAFTNKSDKTITNYSLGCVMKKDNEIFIIDQANSKKANPAKNVDIITPKSSSGNPEYANQKLL